MKVGIPREVKDREYRVGATPSMVAALVGSGHEVLVETNAGAEIGYDDERYRKAGARIVPTAKDAYTADLVIKVKEPVESEYPLLHKGLILYCFLHLAPNGILTDELLNREVSSIAYETVTDNNRSLPLLQPMSEIAGRVSVQTGATYLQKNNGGKGVLLGGVPGVLPAKVVIIGGGIAGTEAAKMARGMGAEVYIIDLNIQRLRYLDELFEGSVRTLHSSPYNLQDAIEQCDLLIGSVLIPGKTAPKLVTREMLSTMQPGSVFVDISIDQGGCSETSRPTTHSDPVYLEEGVIHYCVTNMPGSCAKTATQALTNVTMPFALEIAKSGLSKALHQDPHLRNGLNTYKGKLTNEHVADDQGKPFHAPSTVL